MNMLIDYLTITIKPDKFGEVKLNKDIDLDFIFDFLNLTDIKSNFVVRGKKNFYAEMYIYENIRIYKPYPEQYENMGYCFEFTGSGLRFYERYIEEKLNVKFNWKYFFTKLHKLLDIGIAINVPRLDLAFDDFEGNLKLDNITQCVLNREIVSMFRSGRKKDTLTVSLDTDFYNDKGNTIEGRTVYFGSKSSNVMCRIYDKLIEQRSKLKNNPEELEKLKSVKNWVRLEMVYKNKNAIKIVNSIVALSAKDFSKYIAEAVNGYIRFVNIDDSNVSRRSLKRWWLNFIGTVERSPLTAFPVPNNPLYRAMNWLDHSLAPTLAALIKSVGVDYFMDYIYEGVQERFKQKHHAIMDSTDFSPDEISNRQLWRCLVPRVVANIVGPGKEDEVYAC